MEKIQIDYPEAFYELQKYCKDNSYNRSVIKVEASGYLIQFEDHEQFFIKTTPSIWETSVKKEIIDWIASLKEKNNLNKLIFGKNEITNIVSCEVKDNKVELFIEKDGVISSEARNNRYWIVSPRRFTKDWNELEGNLHYKYIKYYDKLANFYTDKKIYATNDIYSISDAKEAAMVLNGFSYYKGMKVDDVSILSFDIESMGLVHDDKSRILIISNTFKKQGIVERKLFCCDEYETDAEMIDAWCAWVRLVNPSIMCGHNIFGYDLGYMQHCSELAGTTLALGRDESDIRFNKYSSKFRKDGSQDYDYFRAFIYGREIVDTMFVSYHFDFARKYDSYGLKQIIKQEGLEVVGRQFYEAANIAKDWDDLEKRDFIKKYAEHDADDALALYSLMIPAYFYLTPSIPKSFQSINYSASGSQINSLLVRSYLQEGHSISKADEIVKFVGAISDSNPGIYKNVFKVDVSSLYPSVMLQYEIYDQNKDPNANFLKMVRYFTNERLLNKKKAKETKDRYYQEMEQAQKIVINSAYGLLGMHANFNSPKNAALVTEYGRDILKKSIFWATGKEYIEKVVEEEKEDEENIN